MRKQTFILKWAWNHTRVCCFPIAYAQVRKLGKVILGKWPRGQGLSFLTATANKRVQRLQCLAGDTEVREPLLPWPHSLSGDGVKHFHMETGKTSPQLGLEDSSSWATTPIIIWKSQAELMYDWVLTGLRAHNGRGKQEWKWNKHFLLKYPKI